VFSFCLGGGFSRVVVGKTLRILTQFGEILLIQGYHIEIICFILVFSAVYWGIFPLFRWIAYHTILFVIFFLKKIRLLVVLDGLARALLYSGYQ
jgi:hypothetical protein